MENTIYIGLSRLSALQTNMSLIANNIANVNTPGYKANKIVFSEYLDKPKGMKDQMSMVLDYGNYRVADNGAIKLTGNPLDVALEGPGYLQVQTQEGQNFYTRAGNFSLNADRELITQQGYKVLDTGGSTITIPPGSMNIMIDETGSIATDEGIVSQLGVTEFENINNLTPVGNSLYQTTQPGVPAAGTRVVQNALEGSNVQGVLEMTDMIEVSRSYQSVAKMLQAEHDRMRATIRNLTSGS